VIAWVKVECVGVAALIDSVCVCMDVIMLVKVDVWG